MVVDGGRASAAAVKRQVNLFRSQRPGKHEIGLEADQLDKLATPAIGHRT